MSKLRKALHKLTVMICAAQLSVFTSPLMAQPIPGSGNVVENGLSDGAQFGQAIMGVIQEGANFYIQARQQSFAAVQQASLFNQLAPKTQFDIYFGCPIPESESAFVQNACTQPFQSEADLTTAMTLQTIADGYSDYYSMLANPAQNTRAPIGLQCLERAKQLSLDGMTNKLNQLKELRAQLLKAQQQFRDDQQQILDDIDWVNEELRGNRNAGTNEDSAKFREALGDECSNILANVSINVDQGVEVGLLKMKQSLNKPNLDAANFKKNKGQHEKDIVDLVNQIKSDIARDGVSTWQANMGNQQYQRSLFRGKAQYKGIANGVAVHTQNYRSKVQKHLGIISQADETFAQKFNINNIDQNMQVDLQDFIDGAEVHYKKQYVQECVTQSRSGVGLSPKQILKSLYQPSAKYEETKTLRDYREALKGILNDSNITIEQKQAEIQALDETYGGRVKMKYQDNQSRLREGSTAYDYFSGIVNNCEQEFLQDDTFAPTSGGVGARSQATKVKRAIASIRSLKNEVDEFAENIGNEIMEELNHCANRPLKAGECGPNLISPEGDNFCVAHAATCSDKINSCFAKVDQEVKVRQDDLNVKATSFNDRVENFVANQEQILQQIRGVLGAQSEFLSQFFEEEKGRNDFDPESIFIGMPEFADYGDTGLRLRGGGSLDFMKELDEKLAVQERLIQQQKGKLDTKLKTHIANVKGQFEDNQGKWEDLKGRCANLENQFRSEFEAQQQKGEADQAELDKKVGQFCSKFDGLGRVNPGPGCEGDGSPDDLYTEMHEIGGHLDPRVRRYVSQYRNLCNQVSNEGDSEDSNSDDSATAPLLRACNQNGNNWNSAFNSVANNFVDRLPADYAGSKSDIEDYIKNGNTSGLPEDFEESSYMNYARSLMEMGRIDQLAADQSLASQAASEEENRDTNLDAIRSASSALTSSGENNAQPPFLRIGSGTPSSRLIGTEFNDGKITLNGDREIKNIRELQAFIQSDSDMQNPDNRRLVKNGLPNLAEKILNQAATQYPITSPVPTTATDHPSATPTRKYNQAEIDAIVATNTENQARQNAMRSSLNNLVSAFDNHSDAVRSLEPDRAVASNDEEKDPCQLLDDLVEKRIREINTSDASNLDTPSEREAAIENVEEDLDGVNSHRLRTMNRTLREIASLSMDTEHHNEEWINIGERARGVCRAESASGRNSLINQQALQDIISAGQSPSRRNSLGIR